jgi:hypothetical protein
LNLDPTAGFLVKRGPGSKSRFLKTKKLKKFPIEKFEFLYLIINCNIATLASIEDFYAPGGAI